MVLFNFLGWSNKEDSSMLCFVSADNLQQADDIISEMYPDIDARMFGSGIGAYQKQYDDSEWFRNPGYSTWVLWDDDWVDGNSDKKYMETTMLPYYTRQEKIDLLLK